MNVGLIILSEAFVSVMNVIQIIINSVVIICSIATQDKFTLRTAHIESAQEVRSKVGGRNIREKKK